MASFKMLFFRYYDKAIAEGITTFSKIGVGKNDFTNMCSTPGFVLDDESIRRAATAMQLTDEQLTELLEAAAAERGPEE